MSRNRKIEFGHFPVQIAHFDRNLVLILNSLVYIGRVFYFKGTKKGDLKFFTLFMFLNQTSHYALRAMTGMVKADDSKPVSSKELADYTKVPSHYLSKIMRKMVQAGFARSRKGHGGGFVMVVKPEDIRIIDVLAAAGFEVDDQPCVFGWDKCDNKKPCPLHPVWKKLKDSFNDWAFYTTFEDIKKESSIIEENEYFREE